MLAGRIAGNARNSPAIMGPHTCATSPVTTAITPPNAKRTRYSHAFVFFSCCGASSGLMLPPRPRTWRRDREPRDPRRARAEPHGDVLSLRHRDAGGAVDQHREAPDEHRARL